MRYALTRDRDGAGDSGQMSLALWNDGKEIEDGARPRVGVVMRVGSSYARTYIGQDWWQTTRITEIISDTPHEVRFRTTNSVYTWKELT
jgi:hypothetical protein